MKPGRELDALIAEKVMGWRPIIRSEWPCIALANTPDNEKEIAFLRAADLRGQYEDIPNYSTDIAEAWEIIKKLIEYNPFWEEKNCLYFQLSPTNPAGWMCNFGDSRHIEYGDTAPHAICLAALKAVEYF